MINIILKNPQTVPQQDLPTVPPSFSYPLTLAPSQSDSRLAWRQTFLFLRHICLGTKSLGEEGGREFLAEKKPKKPAISKNYSTHKLD